MMNINNNKTKQSTSYDNNEFAKQNQSLTNLTTRILTSSMQIGRILCTLMINGVFVACVRYFTTTLYREDTLNERTVEAEARTVKDGLNENELTSNGWRGGGLEIS